MKFGDTLATELDLVCGAVAKRHFLDTVMMLGLLAGSLIAGPLGELSFHTIWLSDHLLFVQRSEKRLVNIVKQDPGSVSQNS